MKTATEIERDIDVEIRVETDMKFEIKLYFESGIAYSMRLIVLLVKLVCICEVNWKTSNFEKMETSKNQICISFDKKL